MSNITATMTVRLPTNLKERLERLASATQRSKSWLAVDAIQHYLELQEWQVAEIEEGLAEADAGSFASDGEVRAVLDKWGEVGDADWVDQDGVGQSGSIG